MRFDSARGIERREFVKAAVAIGGTSALAACMDRERGDESTTSTSGDQSESAEFPQGDPSVVPDGQHRWGDHLVRDAHGNTVLPQHQLLLGLSYESETEPTVAEREQVTAAFETLDHAFRWGTGTRTGAAINDGLLYTLGYAPRYFERFGAVPDQLDPPEDVLDAVGEDPAKANGHDALLVLTSDFGSIVLAAEAALFGETETVNGVRVDASLDGVFARVDRRTGVVGKGLPAEKLENDDVPEEAPLSMGFKSGFRDSLPAEDRVTLQEGPFAGGTTQAVSRLRIDLDSWYEQSHGERTAEMFCPAHDPDDVGETGSKLGGDSGITEDDVDAIDAHADEHGTVGHSQKLARARDDDFETVILRRSEGVATDAVDDTEFNFSSVQQTVADFVDTRTAMNVDEYDVDVPAERHGIVDYLETRSRGTYLIPSRDDLALPVHR
ncbi:DUF7405 family protein [Halorubellus salinus]|uniref:DUF7405 family protein n=1 Tax=Halorubellus salinus TaxID=755309 RepID=UPI001D05EF96|nr:hypothetical protein [Halorubellus salinus]